MTQNQLMDLLNSHEWRDVEFKEAQRKVPHSAYETVSCIRCQEEWTGHGNRRRSRRRQGSKRLPDDIEATDKISVVVAVQEKLHKYDDSDLLIFYVPEVHRSDKPVFLNGDIRRSFVRSGGSDVRCSDNERNRFLLDAAGNATTAISSISTWIPPLTRKASNGIGRFTREGRGIVHTLPCPTRIFSKRWAFWLKARAGVVHLVRRFCSSVRMRHSGNSFLGRLWTASGLGWPETQLRQENAGVDRFVLDENLVRAWQSLIDWYQRLADRPFRVDPSSLQRDDAPPTIAHSASQWSTCSSTKITPTISANRKSGTIWIRPFSGILGTLLP